MTWGRFVSALFAVVAVAGCAVIVLGMSQKASPGARHERVVAYVAPTTRPAYLPLTVRPAADPSSSAVATPASPSAPRTAVPAVAATSLHASAQPLRNAATRVVSLPPITSFTPLAATTRSPRRVARVRTATAATPASHPAMSPRTPARSTSAAPTTTAATSSTANRQRVTQPRARHVVQRGGKLPLPFRTHNARQVITVVAPSSGSTTATVQAWRKTRSGGWLRRGPRIKAWVGAQGLTKHASESKSATPIGSFTLTHAFGHDSDPGTALPYLHTNPSDWWISQSGRLYNTHQRCSSNCPFTRGDPNEHLYYETPYYNYAVVIDYNTRNAPGGVRQGRGSAFFLHVTVHQPTAGCVAIPQRRLVPIMRWLRPRRHPRILIGVS